MKSGRRKFLKKTAGAGIGLLAIPYIVPSSALGKGGHIAPSDRIVMGAIGVGSMGTGDMRNFLLKKGVQYVAVCDVDKNHATRAKKLADDKNGNKNCNMYIDYREMLDKENLDVMNIALPDHWHAIISVAVAEKGIDIYGQKPLARSIVESRAIVDAVQKNKIIWQTGSWQRSRSNFHRAAELVVNGKIGNINYVEVGLPDGGPSIGTPPVMPVPEELDWEMWLGPAPGVPYRGVSHWNWRWIMDYSGGQLTDWAGHHVDIAHWGLGLDRTGPISVEGQGVYPREGIYNVPVEYDIKCKYKNGIEMRVANRSRLKYGMGVTWYGDEGWLHVSRGNTLFASDKKILEVKIGPNDKQLYKSNDHEQNFLDCVKSRKETITPAEIAHRSISVALLGEIAMLTQTKLDWDPEKERFANNKYANRLLTKPYRKPWNWKMIHKH
jgi:predicted dehydrogenase